MKYFFTLIIFVIALFGDESVKDSIVKIYTVAKVPNYNIPWNSSIRHSHGSGTILENNRILTNAHVVADETFIEVKRYGDTKRYEAEVEFISHQVDLAILKVKDEHFFEGTKSLSLGELPDIQQNITVYGFPMGGNSLSVSTGVVSRIEHNRYAHSGEIFLAIQIDAAINPGNSGGPAISDGKIVGVVMQQITKSQNIGYLVPPQIVKHFLKDIEDGRCDGFAHLGMGTQKMENETLREVYKMSEKQSGVMVLDISENSSLYNTLKTGDVLLAIDGHKIENDGTVEFVKEQFTSYSYYIDQKQLGDSIVLRVLRDGEVIELSVGLTNVADNDLLVNTIEHDVMPRYFIYGGYVFTPLTRNILAKSSAPLLQLREASGKWVTKEKEEAVILLKVLADKTNRGDHNFSLWMIDSVNAKTFKNYSEFKKMVQEHTGEYIILQNKDGIKVAIDTKKAKEIENEILQRYSIQNVSSEF